MSHASDPRPTPTFSLRQRVAEGTSLAVAVLLFTVAVLSAFEGLSALFSDEIYVTGTRYTYRFDTTAWGWIHIVLGLVLALCAVGLLIGTMWGRYAAICLAALSIVMNFLSLPYYPAWSILVIGMNTVVIWAIATWRPDRDLADCRAAHESQ
ncbi:DUF7144 family membrane protein [Nocardia bovistercoris]|uniref:DUF7144 domain-containing protein n=1 Tax=Nocardia bovistercoris TaxID=2785916 RepID=A0A931IBS4_9NOCA|nr:hypothetical protein [Nocardia bovistercoris]MBH0776950.1 hypothetical protein [Nocardia bovistercoris]